VGALRWCNYRVTTGQPCRRVVRPNISVCLIGMSSTIPALQRLPAGPRHSRAPSVPGHEHQHGARSARTRRGRRSRRSYKVGPPLCSSIAPGTRLPSGSPTANDTRHRPLLLSGSTSSLLPLTTTHSRVLSTLLSVCPSLVGYPLRKGHQRRCRRPCPEHRKWQSTTRQP
jgi:hypothetical protein